MDGDGNKAKLSQKILDDLSVRFIINTPEFIDLNPEEYFFVLEQAHWYAMDFYKILLSALLPFAEQILAHNGINLNVTADYIRFKTYRQSIRVFGAMLFSPNMDYVLAVEQMNHDNNITFPKGKKSKNETGVDCAIRETYEEVGYNASGKVVDISTTVFDKITFYCVFNVDMRFPFKTKTRNEISRIFWFDLRRINDVKDRKRYRILYQTYKSIEGRVQEMKRNLFRFDLERIDNAM